MEQSIQNVINVVTEHGIAVALKILGGLFFWIVGKWLIGKAVGLLRKAFDKKGIDSTLSQYAASAIKMLLTVVLVVAILGFFGVETTTFAAVLAGVGLAIGTAWGGLLTNFAAGAFIIVLRPYKVGDYVVAGGTEGTVVSIGMFVTTINSPDNVVTIVGNNKIFTETIKNFSTNPYRRVDLKAQLAHGADHQKAIMLLKESVQTITGVESDPGVLVEVLEFNLSGPVLAVRPFCNTAVYWDVYFATNKMIRETLVKGGFAVAETHHQISKAA